MEDDDGIGDDAPERPLLPPDDRLWRHPSEVASHGLPLGGRRVVPAAANDGRSWPVALLSGAIGALLATGLLAATGQVRGATPVPAAQTTTTALRSPADLAAGVRGVVVRVTAVRADATTATGSGLTIRSDGRILTTQHLVESARSLTVTLDSGSVEPATFDGADADSDLAVIHIDRHDLPTLPNVPSPTLRVGQTAVAVGATVAVGVIAGLQREAERSTGGTLVGMIETDLQVPPASAGGALLDTGGAVVGVTTLAGGECYAVPADTARSVADQILSAGRVSHAWLGISGEDIDGATSRALGLAGGVIVREVVTASPAAAVGAAPTDVVTAMDGQAVGSMAALRLALRTHRPGQTVDLRLLHAGVARTVLVTLVDRPVGTRPS